MKLMQDLILRNSKVSLNPLESKARFQQKPQANKGFSSFFLRRLHILLGMVIFINLVNLNSSFPKYKI